MSPTCGARQDEEEKGEEQEEGYWDRVLVPRDTLCSASAGTLIRLCGLRMLTRQNAEPLLGMKLTLFLSGHRNCGISRGGLALSGTRREDREKTVRISQKHRVSTEDIIKALHSHHFKDQQMENETKTNMGKVEG